MSKTQRLAKIDNARRFDSFATFLMMLSVRLGEGVEPYALGHAQLSHEFASR